MTSSKIKVQNLFPKHPPKWETREDENAMESILLLVLKNRGVNGKSNDDSLHEKVIMRTI